MLKSNSQHRRSTSQEPHRILYLLYEIRSMMLVAITIYLIIALATYSAIDAAWSQMGKFSSLHNWGGYFGAWLSDVLYFIFGLSAWWWCLFLLAILYRCKKQSDMPDTLDISVRKRIGLQALHLFSFSCLMVGSMGMEYLYRHTMHISSGALLPDAFGGVLGQEIGRHMQMVFGLAGAILALLLLFATGVSLFFRMSWLWLVETLAQWIEHIVMRGVSRVTSMYQRMRSQRVHTSAASTSTKKKEPLSSEALFAFSEKRIEPILASPVLTATTTQIAQSTFHDLPDTNLPPLNLLDEVSDIQTTMSSEILEYTSRLIEKKLLDFGVQVTVMGAYPGPVITRYEIELATGIKGTQVVNLGRDLARSLSLTSIRVVEVIPGKTYMGLELPNPKRQIVRLTEMLSSTIYRDCLSPLTIVLGKDIAGHVTVADLAKMPHLLIAGTTGSGKSVGINATLLSFLYKSDPNQVRLILIDPKMLELSIYEGIPHLLSPVVTDMRQAGHALNWAVGEMERRYKLMSKLGVRNLMGYNQKISDAEKKEEKIPNPFSLAPVRPEPLEKLPMIVIVIDELADLMMVVGKKVEELIARIAQKARAAGIHLILATQRPSVDVITGLIKANVPTRIAFQVSSKIDSRTIIDQMGAETLLGMGDMLYLPPGTGLPMRVHGAFVSDDEVHRVVNYLKQQGKPNYIEGILDGNNGEDTLESGVGSILGTDGESDELYDQAVTIVLKHRRASISLVQRHLRIGYNRAARLLEQMEKSGLVSTMQSNGNREVLVKHAAEELKKE